MQTLSGFVRSILSDFENWRRGRGNGAQRWAQTRFVSGEVATPPYLFLLSVVNY